MGLLKGKDKERFTSADEVMHISYSSWNKRLTVYYRENKVYEEYENDSGEMAFNVDNTDDWKFRLIHEARKRGLRLIRGGQW